MPNRESKSEHNDASARSRFEFRTFGAHANDAFERLRRTDTEERRSSSEDLYCLSRRTDRSNVKVRDGQLHVKRLIEVDSDLERWQQTLKVILPVPDLLLRSIVLPSLRVRPRSLHRPKYDLDSIRSEIVDPNPQLLWIRVRKRRWLFTLERCRAEYVELMSGAMALRSVAIESTCVDAVLEARARLGLARYENVSYPRALKRSFSSSMQPSRPTSTVAM